MTRATSSAIYVLTMVAVVVGADVAFLRHRFWIRLLVNMGIIAAAFYLRVLRKP
jgi:hypothetical protein